VFFDHLLGLVDAFGDQDGSRTGLGTFKVVFAGPYAVGIVQNCQSRFETVVAGIGQEAIRLADGGRPQEVGIFFEDRARLVA
jgi:hypothetical protein